MVNKDKYDTAACSVYLHIYVCS